MVLTWPGVPVTACATIRPERSNTPAARSPASRTVEENAVRISVCACSSTMASRRFQTTCSRTSAWPVMSDHDGSIAGNRRIVARRNDGRGGILDDDRRPGERAAGRQVLAVIDVGSDAPGGADVEDLAAACGLRLRAALGGRHRPGPWGPGGHGEPPPRD